MRKITSTRSWALARAAPHKKRKKKILSDLFLYILRPAGRATLFFEPLQIGSRHIELYARPAEVPPRTPQMALVFVEARPQAAIAPQFGSIETPPDGQDSLFTLLRPLR